jgi:hypothetical protein
MGIREMAARIPLGVRLLVLGYLVFGATALGICGPPSGAANVVAFVGLGTMVLGAVLLMLKVFVKVAQWFPRQ